MTEAGTEAAREVRKTDQEKRIKREKTKLRRLLKDMSPDRLRAVDKLINQVAFMGITLEDLAAHINAYGCVSEYQNGENQWGTKKSPEVETHASMMQRYLSALKQFTDLLPEEPKEPAPTAPGGRVRGYIANGRSG
jgi:hypothetical protein